MTVHVRMSSTGGPSDPCSPDVIYTVDKILQKKIKGTGRKRVTLYLVQWVGYGEYRGLSSNRRICFCVPGLRGGHCQNLSNGSCSTA